MLTDSDLQTLRNALMREFGDELAQYAITELWLKLSQGGEVRDPLAWCWTACKRERGRIVHRAKRLLPIGAYVETFEHDRINAEGLIPDVLLDYRSPDRIIEARELLATIPDDLKADALSRDEQLPRQTRHRRRKDAMARIFKRGKQW